MDETRSVLQEVSFQFALRIIRPYKMIVELHKEFVISRQHLKAGTAIGAMVQVLVHSQNPFYFQDEHRSERSQ